MDMLNRAKNMLLFGKQFCYKASGEYETANLHIPYCLIALMLN